MSRTTMTSIVISTIGLMATPLFLAGVCLATVYRLLGGVVLWLSCPGYDGLLNLMEAFFDHEPGTNLNVSNVLFQSRLTNIKNGEDFRKVIIQLTKKNIEEQNAVRMSCVVKQWLGLRYWKIVPIDFEKQIRSFDVSSEAELTDYLSNVANRRIYDNRIWEMYVSKNPLNGEYPIIMRIHHSVGDGYSIRKIVLKAQTSKTQAHETAAKEKHRKGLPIRDVFNSIANNLLMLLNMLSLSLAQYLGPVDDNSLRNVNMSGKKILRWSKGELTQLKDIQKFTGMLTTEILLTALSKALDDLFKSRNESIRRVTVGFPYRITQETKSVANEFVPAAIQLPVDTPNRETDVTMAYRQLKSRPVHTMNYFLPRFFALLCQFPVPNWAYNCTEITCLLSNLPGPKGKVQFDGFEGVGFHYFVPNMPSSNGLGVALSSFADRITYSVIMDESIMKNKDDAQNLADGIAEYIETMHRNIKHTQFLKPC